MTAGNGQRWFFESGSLALDFGYTGDYGYGRPEWERLHQPVDLERWIGDRFGELDRRIARRSFREALRVRTAICELAKAAADEVAAPPREVDVINDAVRAAPVRPHLPGGSARPPAPSIEAILSTIAEDIVSVLTMPGHRVRRCAGAGCQLIFFDHSKPNARRWCSMARCGNRAKIRQHRSHSAQD